MPTLISSKYKISLIVTQRRLQTRVRKRTDNGEYGELNALRTELDLAAFKKAARAMSMMARGINDPREIDRTVNKSKLSRRPKTPPEARKALRAVSSKSQRNAP